MCFKVTKTATELIGPSEPTPSASVHSLQLSFMDRLPGTRFFLELILVFGCHSEETRYGQSPAKAIREAVSKALVHYNPVAGRILNNPDTGEPEVKCSGDGVLFVGGLADCRLEDVEYLDRPPLMIRKEMLLPSAGGGSDENGLIFMMQVTEFTCGGFTVGIRFNHSIFDGMGAAQFIKAISEKAKGLAELTVRPIWCRELIPSPKKSPKNMKILETFKFQRHVTDLSLDYINRLKQQTISATGQKCSVFEIVAATIWQCRTRAIKLDGSIEATLCFPVNVRGEIKRLIASEDGYYGNCIYHIIIQAPSEHIVNAPIQEIIRLIQDAKRAMPKKFWEWMNGDPSEDPPELTRTYAMLDLSDWRRLGFFEVDYGWGTPMHVIPTNDGVKVGSCIFLNPPAPKMGVRLMTHCVVKEHLEEFCKEMEKLA